MMIHIYATCLNLISRLASMYRYYVPMQAVMHGYII